MKHKGTTNRLRLPALNRCGGCGLRKPAEGRNRACRCDRPTVGQFMAGLRASTQTEGARS